MSNPASLVVQANDEQLEKALQGERPVLIWFSAGQTAGIDLRKALEKAAADYQRELAVVMVDTNACPMAKTRFDVEKHPVLVGWHNGESVKRRARPWASDVVGFADVLKTLAPAPANLTSNVSQTEDTAKSGKELKVNNKPVHVTDATFEQEVLNSELPVLVDFWAAWCGPCRMVAPILDKLAGEFAGKVKIAKVDVDANPGVSGAFQIMSIPTLMFVKQGKIVGQAAGAAPEAALRDALNQLVNLQIPA